MKQEYGKILSDYTSLKIGGPVFCRLEPESLDDILESISLAEDSRKGLSIIGRGTNVLVLDKGMDAVVMNLGTGFDFIEKEGAESLRVGAAVPLSQLVKESSESGLGGCEFLAGIPGSFGGAIFMNAGVRDTGDRKTNKEIKDIILDVDVMDLKDKKRNTLKREKIDFAYRSSGLEGKCILGARVKLKKEKPELINNRISDFMKRREWIQRLGFPSAGSIFKNPRDGEPAGRLIELCGLKGRRIGGAEISKAHANFIINTGMATSRHVLDLIELARANVKKKFGIDLELEIKILK